MRFALPPTLLRRAVPRGALSHPTYLYRAPIRLQSQRRPPREPQEPHKEYFQRPGQFAQQYQESFASEPLPPAVPFEGAQQQQGHRRGSRFYGGQQQYGQQPQQRSRWRRFLRASLWSDLFLILGFITGTALVTWDYITAPEVFTAGKEEEVLAEIFAELSTHPVVAGCVADGWLEMPIYGEDGVGPYRVREGDRARRQLMGEEGTDAYVYGLAGLRGVTMREFAHPAIAFTVMVFFLAEGLEDGVWPDTVHGGIVSTLLLRAAERHVRRCDVNASTSPWAGMVDGEGRAKEELVPGLGQFTVDLKGTVQPADIYTIVVPRAVESRMVVDESTGEQMRALTVTPLMLHLDSAPKLTVASVEETQTLVQNLAVEDDSTLTVQAALYAMGTLQCFVRKVKKKEDDG